MQPLVDPPRDLLTVGQIQALVTATNVTVDVGVDLLDSTDLYLSDLSPYVVADGGYVEHDNFRPVHSTCRLQLATSLGWGLQRIRPYMVLSSGGVAARFNLGVYLPLSPTFTAPDLPAVVDVDCVDKTAVLDVAIGSTYRAAAGAGVLASAQTLLGLAGEAKLLISGLGDDKPLVSDVVWPVDPKSTYRKAIDDLLAAAGYQPVWVDWNGYFRFVPYADPRVRAPEWGYDTSSGSTIVAEDRSTLSDFFAVPNKWVFINDDPSLAAPVEGAGVYTKTNGSSGVTSVAGRGRTITSVVHLSAVDQATLVVQGEKRASEDQQVNATFRFRAGPNPLHWHMDVVSVSDPLLSLSVSSLLVSSWRLPLDGGDMDLTARGV